MEIAMPTRMEINNFNSIKVQLELASRLSLNSISLFQFHKGTIRTREYLITAIWVPSFQFHKGTIRTSKVQSLVL